MLENILSEINKNLERIANSLECNKNMKETATAEVKQTPNDVSVATPVQAVPTQYVKPAQHVIPATVIPATPQAESFTQEQLAVAMSNAVSAGKMNVVMEILGKFNVQALTQVNPADYNKLATMLREAGVNV